MKHLATALLLALGPFVASMAHGPAVTFVENRGQWPQQVLYRANVPGGAVFVERQALTFVQFSGLDLHAHGQAAAVQSTPRGHAYRVHFVEGMAQWHDGGNTQPHYENHFIGNDPARWGAGCAVHGEVWLRGIWPGIDMRLDGRHGLKYDLVVAPGADPAMARLRYEGADALSLQGRELHVGLSTGLVVEEAPVVYTQGAMGDRHPVEAHYALQGDRLHFHLPEGYDPAEVLVIDPILTFSSFSGSTADNFGFTATYDAAGHTYGGGIVFNIGYPTSMGAFDPTFNGGTVDVGISKWTPAGNALVWSTYLGGNGADAPHSLVVNDANELFVMGSTGSATFPVTPGCFMGAFQGGPGVNFSQGYGFGFNNGADIFLARLNATATALLGATYVGGSGTDGVNTSTTAYNYGDAFRGEVALTAAGEPVVITSTSSINVPVSPGAPQPVFGGGTMDAYVFRMDAGLTTLQWATYRGGNGADAGHGVQFSSNGDIYITGGTTSTDLAMAGTPLQPGNSGGIDGFVARYNASGTSLLSATYLGTSAYDQCFLVQLDNLDNVYAVGQTRGNYPVTPGVYANPGSSQFIHKLNADLSATLWSTRIGNGNGNQDLSPSAFLVSECGQIFFSGWAGSTNNFGTPTSSTTNGSPVTPDAFQSTTDGSDFYLMVLEPDATGLSYATFFGGTAAEHVDGGTSRFDKNGKVYQAVCAGCGGSYPTTAGSSAPTNGSSNCNLGVFKFDLNIPIASIDIAGDSVICFPSSVQFVNNSVGGNTYAWNFGDGGTSTEFEPAHTYTGEGVFNVTMVMTDQYGCTQADTASIQIVSLPPPQASIDPVPVICPGASVQLNASEGTAWNWFPAEGLSSTTVRNPVATPAATTVYQVEVTTTCGVDTATVEVVVAQPTGSALPDAAICLGGSTTLGASGGASYAWSPPTGLSSTTVQAPVASPTDTTTYTVTITTAEGCTVVDSVTVNVVFQPPQPALVDTTICLGGSAQLWAPQADSYIWQSAPGLSDLTVRAPIISPQQDTWYVVVASNLCGSIRDSALVSVFSVLPEAWPDTLICPGDPVQLQATGGSQYTWSPATGLSNPTVPDPVAVVFTPTTYTVTVVDGPGCSAQASVSIGLLPPPTVSAGSDRLIEPGQQVLLEATGSAPGSYQWEPPWWLACDSCATTWAAPESSTTYTVTLTAGNGCTATAKVTIVLTGTLFVPNTFTPNGDGTNDLFGAYGSEIATLQLFVFDRWGELIFSSDSMDRRWDGTYKGRPAQVDTYVWKVEATELSGRQYQAVGHVNLVR